MAAQTTSQLFRVRKTVIKMLVNRKYLVSTDDVQLTFDDFKERFGRYPLTKWIPFCDIYYRGAFRIDIFTYEYRRSGE